MVEKDVLPVSPKPRWVVRFPSPAEVVHLFLDVFEDMSETVSWYEDEASQKWWIEAIFQTKPSFEDISALIEEKAAKLQQPLPLLAIDVLFERDWLAENFRSFQPIIIGRFYLYGSHNQGAVPPGKIGIHLDAATAFGSGRHETTQGCLLALEKMAETKPWTRPLDMGCGSGILALAIALLRPGVPVFACDFDPEAVRVTRENSLLNQLSTPLQVIESDGFSAREIQESPPYDLIVANILAKPLKKMVSGMVDFLDKNGRLILSGILDHQAPELIKIYRKSGFFLEEEKRLGVWSTLAFRK